MPSAAANIRAESRGRAEENTENFRPKGGALVHVSMSVTKLQLTGNGNGRTVADVVTVL